MLRGRSHHNGCSTLVMLVDREAGSCCNKGQAPITLVDNFKIGVNSSALLLSRSVAYNFDSTEPRWLSLHWASVTSNDARQSSAFRSQVEFTGLL